MQTTHTQTTHTRRTLTNGLVFFAQDAYHCPQAQIVNTSSKEDSFLFINIFRFRTNGIVNMVFESEFHYMGKKSQNCTFDSLRALCHTYWIRAVAIDAFTERRLKYYAICRVAYNFALALAWHFDLSLSLLGAHFVSVQFRTNTSTNTSNHRHHHRDSPWMHKSHGALVVLPTVHEKLLCILIVY